jgi:2-polyprenyl-6-methoxyphenol hydroxylase-like FAD-dependent oxidoreductase
MMTLADRTRLRVTHPYIAMVPQGDFLTLLAEAATTEKTRTLRMRPEMTGLMRDGGRVAGICYQTAEGTDGELGTDLVITADGQLAARPARGRPEPTEYDCPFDV